MSGPHLHRVVIPRVSARSFCASTSACRWFDWIENSITRNSSEVPAAKAAPTSSCVSSARKLTIPGRTRIVTSTG